MVIFIHKHRHIAWKWKTYVSKCLHSFIIIAWQIHVKGYLYCVRFSSENAETARIMADIGHNFKFQVLKNMGEILKAGGASYSSVVKTTIMYEVFSLPQFDYIECWHQDDQFLPFNTCRLADLKDFKKVNDIYAKCEFCTSKFKVSMSYILVSIIQLIAQMSFVFEF